MCYKRLHVNALMAHRSTHSKQQILFLYRIHLPLLLANKDKSKINPSLFWCHFEHSSHTLANTYKRPLTHTVQRQTRATLCKVKWIFRFKAKKPPRLNEKNCYNNILPIMLDHTKKKIKITSQKKFHKLYF